MPLEQAIVEACRTRLRPILMTTSAIIAGLIPTALGIGIGGAQRSAIAVTIIGGQSLCLFLTLLLVPAAYVKLDALEQSLANQRLKAVARQTAITLRARDEPAGLTDPRATRGGSGETTLMRKKRRSEVSRFSRFLAIVLLMGFVGIAFGQSSSAPRNDLPQPYRTTRDWGELPPAIKKWPAVTAIEGRSRRHHLRRRALLRQLVHWPKRATHPEYDANGKLLKAWGEGLFDFPHGATVDRQGNLWVTDARGRGRQGSPGVQVRSQRQGADDARQGRRQRLGPRSLRSADRCRRRAERRHLRDRQPSRTARTIAS